MKQRIWIFIFSIILCVILTGCIKKDERGQKQKVVYVVCRRSVIPVQLGKLIDEQRGSISFYIYDRWFYLLCDRIWKTAGERL